MGIINLIGEHPDEGNFIGEWLNSQDLSDEDEKKHRHLVEKDGKRQQAVDWFGDRLVDYHVHPKRMERLIDKYKELDLNDYAHHIAQKGFLPTADKTKKGNAGEILLSEYMKATKGETLVDTFKIRYNPNVEQAIKGDDTLLFDVIDDQTIQVYLGESKFRATADKTVILDIISSLSEDKVPLSFGFIVSQLYDKGQDELAARIDDLNIQLIKQNKQITYVGLLLSDSDCHTRVQTHLTTENKMMVMISMGVNDPGAIIEASFTKAQDLLNNPVTDED